MGRREPACGLHFSSQAPLSSRVCECPVAAGTHHHTHVRTRVHTCTHVLAHSAPRGLTGLVSGSGLQGKSLFLPSSSLQRHLLSWPMASLCVQSRLPICDSAPPQKDPWDDPMWAHLRFLNFLTSARWVEGTWEHFVLFLQLHEIDHYLSIRS